MKLILLTAALILLAGCAPSGPVAINFGTDECTHCHMTLSDKRFGAEYVTNKGKAFKFDDLRCMTDYLKENKIPATDIAGYYVVDFGAGTGDLVDARSAFYLQSEALRSPMAGNTAAFSSSQKRDEVNREAQGKPLTWAEVNR
jgi:copper chaperone NosL